MFIGLKQWIWEDLIGKNGVIGTFLISISTTVLIVQDDDDDDDDVTGLRNTKACPNYEAVWARTGDLLIQPGSKLRQWST